jgi:hypothetical protein
LHQRQFFILIRLTIIFFQLFIDYKIKIGGTVYTRVDDVDKTTWDITATNPNRPDTSDKRTPQEILEEIEQLDFDAAQALAAIKELLS